MVGMCLLLLVLWLFILISLPFQSMGSLKKIDPSTSEVLGESRGYPYGYSPPAVATYPVIPFLEPLVILSVIAFIAFLIHTFHTLYLAHRQVYSTSAVHSPSLLGGVVESLVPTRHRAFDIDTMDDGLEDVLKAIRVWSTKKRRQKSSEIVQLLQDNINIR